MAEAKNTATTPKDAGGSISQKEYDALVAEKEALAAEVQNLTAENQSKTAQVDKLAAKNAELSAELEQVAKELEELQEAELERVEMQKNGGKPVIKYEGKKYSFEFGGSIRHPDTGVMTPFDYEALAKDAEGDGLIMAWLIKARAANIKEVEG